MLILFCAGDSDLILRPEKRHRCTFSAGDSGGGSAELATAECFAHVADALTDEEVVAVFEVATGIRPSAASTMATSYKEVQIHGALDLRRHVAALVLGTAQRTADGRKLATSWKATHGVPVAWADEVDTVHALWGT